MADETSTNPTLEVTALEHADADAAADDAEAEVSITRFNFISGLNIWFSQLCHIQEILAMKSRLEEIEREAEALRQMREAQEREAKAIAAVAAPTSDENEMETEDAQAADERSVYVGNVSLVFSVRLVCIMTKTPLLACRLTIARHPRKFKLTSNPVGL